MTDQSENEKTVKETDGTVSDPNAELPATIDEQPEAETASGNAEASDSNNAGESTRSAEAKVDQTLPTEVSNSLRPRTIIESTEPGPSLDQPGERTNQSPSLTAEGGPLRSNLTSLPEHIAGYETISRLGEGTFGVVLKCRDTKLDREVAIKIQKINPMKSRGRIDRFLKEARAAGQLRHPHIIPVYEFGEFGGNQFIAYEYVDGQTLDTWIEENPDLRTRVKLLARIADALDYAHSLQIVHRDIKPANILIDAEHHQPHVADFGCAKYEGPDEMQTVDGSMMGTPAYMSPEVCDGFANQADGRADQWALGILLYEMLTGSRPFQGKYSQLFQQIKNLEPARPSQLKPDVPEELETIALKCLQKDKQRRFDSCGDLASDLRCWLEGRPISARKVGTLERTVLWARRNPSVASLLGAVATCLVGIAIVSTWFSIHSSKQRAAIEKKQSDFVESRIDAIATASAAELPNLISNLVELDPESIDGVKAKMQDQKRAAEDEVPFKLALYKLARASGESGDSTIQELAEFYAGSSLADYELEALFAIVGDDLKSRNSLFWKTAKDSTLPQQQRATSAAVLARTDPQNESWNKLADPTIEFLLSIGESDSRRWAALFQPVAGFFESKLSKLYHSSDPLVGLRTATIVSALCQDKPAFITQLAIQGTPSQIRNLATNFVDPALPNPPPQTNLDFRANQKLVASFKNNGTNPTVLESKLSSPVRHRLISRFGPAGIPVETLLKRVHSYDSGSDNSEALSAIILALGYYDQQQLFQSRREKLKPVLLSLFCEHPDVRVHSASRWLLNRWGFQDSVNDQLTKIQSSNPRPGHTWHEDKTGICFAVFEPVQSHQFGPGKDYSATLFDEMKSETASIPYRFGIAIYETTNSDFADWETRTENAYRKAARSNSADQAASLQDVADGISQTRINRGLGLENMSIPKQAPITGISWDYVALFCNGMNRIAGLPTSTDVYSVSGAGVWRAKSDKGAIRRLGYRMPTSREWEIACGRHSEGRYFFGNSSALLEDFAWSVGNSGNQLQPVGQLRPNDKGLFDILGNASEWCHDVFDTDATLQSTRLPRIIRGQNVLIDAENITVFWRSAKSPGQFSRHCGIRLARTYPDPD